MVCKMISKNNITFVSSVEKAPAPTLVVYALTMPMTSPIFLGCMPSPEHTPPIVQFDEVTYGYVPLN